MIALVDCNNFFASCEQLRNPQLKQKPLIVVSGKNGIILALSKEAKHIGLKRGMPVFKYQKIIRKHQVIQRNTDHRYYASISQKVMDTLKYIVENIKLYSIDEAFLFLDNIRPSLLEDFGKYVRNAILKETGIETSIGIAKSKTLAKIASRYAKKHEGYHGVCLMISEEQRIKALQHFPIEEVWGIGRQSVKKLKANNILTAAHFCEHSKTWAKYIMHSAGETTWRELHGENCAKLSDHTQKQSISITRTFAEMTNNKINLEEAISNFTASCARKLRKQHSVTQEITVFLRTNRFRQDMPQIKDDFSIQLPVPSSDSTELIHYARLALQAIYKPNIWYKRAGVIFSRIQDKKAIQGNLFDMRNRNKKDKLMKVMDELQQKYGQNSVYIMAQGNKKEIDLIDLSILHS
jgi:DNA polymerase V